MFNHAKPDNSSKSVCHYLEFKLFNLHQTQQAEGFA